ALALQSTLSNFFAGVYILVDKPVKVGDYVSIDSESSGVTGFVKEIGWRNTKIQSFGNTVFVLPNDKVANSTIINYSSAKDKGRGVLFDVGVDYSSDADKVERLLREAVKEAAKKNEQIVKDFEPVVRFENFGDSALYFKVIFRVQDYTARWSAEAQVKRRILDLFRKNKVSVPFPIRTVYLKK
ncbi:mechanosensitive ion channel protein MscS, partial [Candidatus Micrarchaeota archaeon CG09_land_8_20_14_0_10_55_25]